MNVNEVTNQDVLEAVDLVFSLHNEKKLNEQQYALLMRVVDSKYEPMIGELLEDEE